MIDKINLKSLSHWLQSFDSNFNRFLFPSQEILIDPIYKQNGYCKVCGLFVLLNDDYTCIQCITFKHKYKNTSTVESYFNDIFKIFPSNDSEDESILFIFTFSNNYR